MKLCIISDTHNKHDQVTIPECDVLIHCGDISNRGSLMELFSFTKWMKEQPATYKVCTVGNHDSFYENHNRPEAEATMKQFGITCLFDSEIIIDGIKFWGTPWSKFFYDWSFNLQPGKEIAEKWALIPDDTNILICHQPPFGVLDLIEGDWENHHGGCVDLMNRVGQLDQLKVICYGHLHLEGGNQTTLNGKIFANAAICDDKHRPIHKPIVIDI